jgi:NADH:ubiquinone oxidoreductase subunit 2 (subunit N)
VCVRIFNKSHDKKYKKAADDIFFGTVYMLGIICVQQLIIAENCDYFLNKKYFFFNDMICLESSIIFIRVQIIVFSIIASFLLYKSVFRSSFIQIESIILFVIAIYSILFLVVVYDIFLMYICLEVIFLSTLGLTVFCFSIISLEAALKYFVQNIVVSAVSLVGLGFIFYFCKSTNIYIIKLFVTDIFYFKNNALIAIVSISFILWLSNILFKLGVYPLYIYSIDVYEVCTSSLIFFISSVVKVSYFFILIKIFLLVLGEKLLIVRF